ncbi:MAG TPA: hypothetical protein VGM27_09795 [Acidobacteriaceae bacterium]
MKVNSVLKLKHVCRQVEPKDIPTYKEWIGTLGGLVNADVKARRRIPEPCNSTNPLAAPGSTPKRCHNAGLDKQS